ncbi:cysteinyl-tRNA synthetase [Coprinopsis cinerea okayama7|uniref:cysteine--tRNA ligase n=1 Tax=Coprinopsis cinerea (strain Okayama-7 / 130 / ATCC MYA-4618 / FGSC 9003) TaxID=240176 RepID=D6RL79_COPC7|nr:cysteinyl-tRNA synthetase [Coprinopsis cinerea okayama7\|eukprot:XP_002911681.1 cysteinyl-tRNA synthetase [Coprinopsis cinerea okayama7\
MALENRDPPAWSPPHPSISSSTPLVLYNSLTKTKTPFIPVDPSGRKVTWYCCGPTVYDAGHLGHARNYLTTDVLRRIMRDYFGYEVEFVQNVTDVDDKIIKRAREQHFLAKYKADHPKIDSQVLADTRLAYDKYAQDTAGFPHDTVSIEQLPEWMTTQKTLLESPILDETQTIFKVRILALDSVAKALRDAQNNPSPDPSQFWPLVDSVLSIYLGDVKKSEISPDQHAIFADYAAYWENHFNEDLRTLNILPPTVTTRVSEFIPENIAFVQQIIDNGFAYAIPGGTVYFDVDAFERAGHYYAKLEPGNRKGEAKQEEDTPAVEAPTNVATTSEAEIQNEKAQKRSPRDFALWKKSRVGEPGWESPWGYGRPGWHIECSAMASQVLGAQFDIHSGGIDLAFPHHDNELAQSEAYWHKNPKESRGPVQWVNYFIHMGHLSIAGSKMSKSLKNFISIRDALASGDWTARKLRILFMMGGWKGGLEISQNFRAEVDLWEKTVTNFFSNVEALTRESETSGGPRPRHLFRSQEKQLFTDLETAQKDLHVALCDSFNTGSALSTILDLISKTNTYLKENQKSASNPDAYFSLTAVREVARWVTKMLRIFGLSTSADLIGWGTDAPAGPDGAQNKEAVALPYVQALSRFRDQVKSLALVNKTIPVCQELLQLCDSLRDDQLLHLGVSLEDRDSSIGEPALIKFGDPAELLAAREAKVQAQLEKEAKKAAAKAEAERLEREKAEKARVRPQDMFRTEEYSEWDEDGLPTKDAQGEEVTKSKKKTLKKAWDKQKKLYETQLAKDAADAKG